MKNKRSYGILAFIVIISVVFSGCIQTEVTEEQSKEIARQFVLNSPTYRFDGFDLEYKETYTVRCPFCWAFIFEFKSRYAGYGDRTGKVLATVITPHTASVMVERGIITSAVLDKKWDMIKQEEISEEEYCTKIDTNESMSLTEAKQIAINSECGNRLKETYMCNEYTGTWWIDLEIVKEGCNPACVVNIVTKQAEINWRCTGLL